MKKVSWSHLRNYYVQHSAILQTLLVISFFVSYQYLSLLLWYLLDWIQTLTISTNLQAIIWIFWMIILMLLIFFGIPLVTSIFWSIFLQYLFRWKGLEMLKYKWYIKRLTKLCSQKTQNIDEILKITELSNILLWKFINFWNLQKKTNYQDEEIRNFVKEEVNKIWNILLDLRSDLQIRLTEQKQILKSAKSEVTENIQWTTDLARVSELQRKRLDKQIEQFEELQKVLVKS